MDIPKITFEDDEFFIQFDKGIVWRKFKGFRRNSNCPYWKRVDSYDGIGYLRFNYKGKKTRLHRFIYEKFQNVKLNKNQIIDHQNRVRDDNRIVNLKLVNKSGNEQNKGKPKNCSSIYRGVCFRKDTNKWKAEIQNPSTKKVERLGCFESEIEAAMKYIERAEQFNALYNANYNIT